MGKHKATHLNSTQQKKERKQNRETAQWLQPERRKKTAQGMHNLLAHQQTCDRKLNKRVKALQHPTQHTTTLHTGKDDSRRTTQTGGEQSV
eukprot:NODE_445_length_889_cov_130.500000_g389_i0.p3 GENE.NODE_445_length_889_cov_130.500000_g389_i0~~NODE_445_length_889_cov_130.500000_g389_i0.p3  ORF type:complete len:91 (-),score=28.58 NODE_445_length_889_cov_130.500000_g389_i0:274-546(-)